MKKSELLMYFNKNIPAWVAVIAGLICFAVYFKALSCEFINWDDQIYIINNTGIRSLDRKFWVWAFTTIPINFWLPMTWVSYAVDYHFWGMNPTGYHLTNNILHAFNAGLVVFIADRLFRRNPEIMSNFLDAWDNENQRSLLYGSVLLLAALLWGIHPARVESVAWATERKDVLNNLFLFISIIYYLRHVDVSGNGNNRSSLWPYMVSLLFYLFSLMAKPSGVILPLMLLVLDWYPLGRFKRNEITRLILEKVPYLLLAGAVAAITIRIGSSRGAYIPLSEFPLDARFFVIGNALFEYCRILLLPSEIITYYHLPLAIPYRYIYQAWTAFAVLVLFLSIGRRRPWFMSALLLFLIPLLPVLQFFPNGFQTALCVRYTYLPMLFPSILLAALASKGCQKLAVRFSRGASLLAVGLVVFLLVYYGVVTQRLIGDWENSGTFWTSAIENQPFERAYFYRGLYYVDTSNYSAAVTDYTKAMEMLVAMKSQDIYNMYAFRGEAHLKAGHYEAAMHDFTAAISIFPHKLYFYHRGMAFLGMNRAKEADEDFLRAGQAKGQMYWFPVGSRLE